MTTDADAESHTFSVVLTLDDGYAFRVDPMFGSTPGFVIDETPPLGEGRGPNPARVLASAMASCLGSSLLFCLRKSHVDVRGLRVIAEGTMVRNERRRLRIGQITMRLEPDVGDVPPARLARCREIFEDFCIVTESVRQGIAVEVEVVLPGVGGA